MTDDRSTADPRIVELHQQWEMSYMLQWPNPLLPTRREENPMPRFIRHLERISEIVARFPPGSWLNHALGGPAAGQEQEHEK